MREAAPSAAGLGGLLDELRVMVTSPLGDRACDGEVWRCTFSRAVSPAWRKTLRCLLRDIVSRYEREE